MTGKQIADIAPMMLSVERNRGSVTQIANRLGDPGPSGSSIHEWLRLTPKENLPKPMIVLFPKPPKAADGSLLYDRVPNKILQMLPDMDVSNITVTGSHTNAIDESNPNTEAGMASSTSLEFPTAVVSMDIDSSTSKISGDVIISGASTSTALKRKMIDDSSNNVESEF